MERWCRYSAQTVNSRWSQVRGDEHFLARQMRAWSSRAKNACQNRTSSRCRILGSTVNRWRRFVKDQPRKEPILLQGKLIGYRKRRTWSQFVSNVFYELA